jgi:PAS domain S-box-containing protein
MDERDRANILMVDDQPGKLMSYEVILKDLGENLIQARSATQALEQLLRNDVAVVLMDVSMPEIDGFELADMIRQHPRFQKTAIIFISAVHLSDLDRIRAYQSGAVDYISVPVIPELLRAKVSVFAELYRKTRQLERLNSHLEERVQERSLQLGQSEAQFRNLANSIPQLAWMADAAGQGVWYNQRWCEFTGCSHDDLVESGWAHFRHPDHVERVLKGISESIEANSAWEDTFPLRNAAGEYRWFLWRAVPLLDSDGRLARWFGTGTDVTEQIKAEGQIRSLNAQLQERVAELEAIMQVLPVGVAISHDPEAQVITANLALSQLLGVAPGENISSRVNPSSPNSLRIFKNGHSLPLTDYPLVRAAATAQPTGSLELEIWRSDGGPVYLQSSASPLFSHDMNVRGAVGAFIDVTERKRLEDLLRERAELLELATEAIFVRHTSGELLYWNAGAEDLYGWRREEVIGKKIHDVLKTRFPVEFKSINDTLAETGRWTGQLMQSTRDGREVTVACRKALKASGDAILEINRDITAQLRAEEALRNAERLAAMGRVAGIIAHEINNPLEAITNTFYLLRDHPSLDDEARYFAKLGEEELIRVAHITRQTLGFYRESKSPVEIALPTLIDEILELQLRRPEFKTIRLEKRYSTSGMIRGFPVELKQVFLNLIGNAIQAMSDGGTLRLHVFRLNPQHRRSSEICVTVCDTGTGIDPEHAKHLFEPFFTTKSVKGTGLGLWISKGIVQKYGGSIRFRSLDYLGRHITCFEVTLPESDERASVLASPLQPQEVAVNNGNH